MKKAACFSILNSRMDHACFHSLNLKLLLSSADERWGRTPTQLQSRWFPVITIEDIRLLHIYQPVGEGVMARGRERRPQRSKFVRIQFLNLDSKQLLVI
ncbi:uncharacterized protein LOC110935160 isoform X2 [Helianthus annuus]|uniref:uncharacterized protein LOC110935160 isoform X2 n=1 Tax=Helianthus annuus TaxID=4232 RepID=UPI000B900905|nr:uncharacterized protein LOC110935160 isoform X2 [Helianthus annuus]